MTNKQQQNKLVQKPEVVDGEIDLLELAQTIWVGKWLIIGITTLFAVGSVLYALNQPNIYQAEAKLASTKESQGGMAALGGQLGGLASLAGINMPRGEVDNSQLAKEIIQSRAFLTDFVERRGILPDLMAAESWNESSGKLTYAVDVYDSTTETWVVDAKSGQKMEPSSWQFVEKFRSILSVDTDVNSGLVTIRIQHLSPVLAKQWVDWLIEDINDVMRRRDVQEAQRSIEFIERELSNTRLASSQQVYSSLLEQQTQTIMLANVRPEYVFRVIDPAVVPEQRAKPNRALIAVIGTLVGGLLGLFLVLIFSVITKYRKTSVNAI